MGNQKYRNTWEKYYQPCTQTKSRRTVPYAKKTEMKNQRYEQISRNSGNAQIIDKPESDIKSGLRMT